MSLLAPPPMTSQLTEELDSALALCEWIAQRQEGNAVVQRDTNYIPGTLFNLVIGHHYGIAVLVREGLNGSAFVLLRSTFEAVVRGCWFMLCATQEEIDVFKTRDKLPDMSFAMLIQAVEEHAPFSTGTFSQLKADGWPAMNSYTHGGRQHVSRQIAGDTIRQNYGDGATIEVLKTSGALALIALGQIAVLADNYELIREVNDKLKEPL